MRVKEIKSEAKERFALNREHAMIIYGVVYTLALNIALLSTLLCVVSKYAIWYCIILIIVFLLLLGPFGFGMTGFYLKMYRAEKAEAQHIFDGFNKKNLERVIVLLLLKFVLWLAFTILLIVPGIIFLLRTSMSVYLLRANPELKPKDALKLSNKVMKGRTGKYFGLALSFAGWFLLGIITCGLVFIWVLPYFNSAKVVFYKRELEGDTGVYVNRVSEAPEEVAALTETELLEQGEVFPKLPESVTAEELPEISNVEHEAVEAMPDERVVEAEPERVYTKPITVIYEKHDTEAVQHASANSGGEDSVTQPRVHVREPSARASAQHAVHEREHSADNSRARAIEHDRQRDGERRGTDRRNQGIGSEEIRRAETGEAHEESVRERLERLRAERNASKQDGGTQNDELRRRHERERGSSRER
ncbi:MAG: DUF975 family protein [Clostridia bacterium]|nr:DUF975 family protein [Clostridia bacterium]